MIKRTDALVLTGVTAKAPWSTVRRWLATRPRLSSAEAAFVFGAILLAALLILLSLPLLAADWNQYYFRFELTDKAQIPQISKIVSIDNVRGNWVYAYANDAEWAKFGQLGYRAQLLPAPASQYPAVMSANPGQLREWDSYPTYSAYVALMNSFAANYPNLCQIVNVGTSWPKGKS